jgi:glycosyltransferase involved in cell wall biosynthesis
VGLAAAPGSFQLDRAQPGMRIAYIASYQGPTLVARRPIVRNRSLAGNRKMELIATLLRRSAHQVEIISQGEVIEPRLTFYPGHSEPERFHPDIPIYYASVLPIRRLNGLWSNLRTLQLFRARHKARPYHLVIIYNLKRAEVTCAKYAMRRLGLPVVIEYEDDVFVDVMGRTVDGFLAGRHRRACKGLLETASGGIAVSPHLMSQLPSGIPRLLLRGVVGDDVVTASERSMSTRENRVLFSGTHIESNGVAQLLEAWKVAEIAGWELHVTGYGGLTESLRQQAQSVPGTVFHGLVSREELVRLMGSAKICINPHAVSTTPGNVFAFKLVEYLAAGAHVITTPMGAVEAEIEYGLTYMADNVPGTIATTLRKVIGDRLYERTAAPATQRAYGPRAVTTALEGFLKQVMDERASAALGAHH